MPERMWRNRNSLHYWWECKLVPLLWKTVWQFLKDLEPEIPFDPAIPLLDIYPMDYKSFSYKDTCTHMFTAALFTIAKTWNQPKCPSMIDWIKKMWHIYTIKYYAAIRKNYFISFAGICNQIKSYWCSKPPRHTYIYVTNLHILHMYPRTYSKKKKKVINTTEKGKKLNLRLFWIKIVPDILPPVLPILFLRSGLRYRA